jgi:UDP-N-acetyl-D-mannosaminuronate dehydrogenase
MSVTYRLNETLIKHGFDVTVHDAEYSTEEIMAKGFTAVSDIYESKAEVVFLVTMHKEYFQLDFEKLAKNGVRFFIDGRNSINRDDVEKSGISYTGIGR